MAFWACVGLLFASLGLQAQSGPIGSDQVVPIGTSYNVYTILLEQQNQVAYNADLNTVVFGHRQNNGVFGGSGGVSFDRSLDGGQTWQNNFILSPGYNSSAFPGVLGCRYPNTAIANLDGNTDPSKALTYMQGPALSANTSYTWGLVFGHSGILSDGSQVDERYANSVPGVEEDFHPMGLTALENGKLISVSTRYRNTPASDFERMLVHIGTLDTLQEQVRWTLATSQLVPDYLRTSTNAAVVADGIPNMAFGPGNRVGYIVTTGARVSDPQATPTPIVYRTTNGGTSWEELPGYAFGQDSAMAAYLSPTALGNTLPFFEGFDMAVDRDDRLHLFARVRSRVSANVDSFNALSSAPGDGGLFHCITRDGAQWDIALVDSLRNTRGAYGSTNQPNRVQMSRSQSGGKVFFAWTASAGAIGSPNNAPNLYLRGYDVDDQVYTAIKSPTLGSVVDGICNFPTIAPVVMESDTTVDWGIPTVIANPSSSGGSIDLNPTEFYYLRGIGFNASDFPDPVCNSSLLPRNQSHQFRSSRVQLHWDPMPGAIACKVELQKLATGTSRTSTVFGADFNGLGLGYTSLPSGFAATWRVQCACGTSPLDTSAFTIYGDSFRLPSGVREMTDVKLPGSSMVLSPNPASDEVRILMESASGENANQDLKRHQLRLFDAAGRLVLEQTFRSDNAQLRLSALPEGWYVVEVRSGDAVQREKLLLLR